MIQVYTRSINDTLFNLMRSLIPDNIQVNRMTGYDRWEDALTFIQDVIKEAPAYAVIVDEDCFIHDWQAIERMTAFMGLNKYTHAGMPDRGAVPHRTNRATTINPFFNILDCAWLRELGALDKPNLPDFNTVPEFEIFDNLYLQMWKVGNPLYLQAATRADGITTHLKDYEGNYFALHSWYSREYVHNGEQRLRIRQVYKDAKAYKG